MVQNSNQLRSVDTLTFDCYGTLIDWDNGIGTALAGLKSAGSFAKRHEVFDAYSRIEAVVEAEPYRRYRDILSESVRRLGDDFGFSVSIEERQTFAESVGRWPPFADTGEALRRLSKLARLGIVSNVDDDLLAATRTVLPDVFDFFVTAEAVESYKPGDAHFLKALEAVNGRKERWMHVAQSLFHDGVPAARLGVSFAWINRRREENSTTAQPIGVFGDLGEFADWFEELHN